VAKAAPAAAPLPESRAGLLNELDQLRHERGEALLDGREYDGARIAAIEARLIEQDDIEAARRQRELAARSVAEAEAERQLNAAIEAAWRERLDALGTAQAAFDLAASELQRFLELTARIRAGAAALRRPSEVVFDQRVAETRLSRWIGARLLRLAGHNYEFGDVAVHGTPSVEADWRGAEVAAAGAAIVALLGADAGPDSPPVCGPAPLAAALLAAELVVTEKHDRRFGEVTYWLEDQKAHTSLGQFGSQAEAEAALSRALQERGAVLPAAPAGAGPAATTVATDTDTVAEGK
jgi:hypothetical protein